MGPEMKMCPDRTIGNPGQPEHRKARCEMGSKLCILASVLMIGVLILGGCGPSRPQAASIDVSCDDFMRIQNVDREVAVPVDGSLTVTLCSNPTTGFRWESARIGDQTVMEETSHKFVPPQEGEKPPAPGTAGREVWTFRVLRQGESTVSMDYSQPWGGGEKAAWTVHFTVAVE
jgi:predicted secreted protein